MNHLSKTKWLFFMAVLLVFAWHTNASAWQGWTWPQDVTLQQAGAELQAAIFLLGALFCMGVYDVLDAPGDKKP